MHPRTLLPALIAIAAAVSLSHAAETYTGSVRTDFGTERRASKFELEVDGSKIAGYVFSPALSRGYRVHGKVNQAGRFSLRSANDALKGRITGIIRDGRLEGRGQFHPKLQSDFTVTLAGQRRLLFASPSDDILGFYMCTASSGALYGHAEIIIEKRGDDYGYKLLLMGKPGQRRDEMNGPLKQKKSASGTSYMGSNDYNYVIKHPDRDSVAPMTATLQVYDGGFATVKVTTDGWKSVSPDPPLPRRSDYTSVTHVLPLYSEAE